MLRQRSICTHELDPRGFAVHRLNYIPALQRDAQVDWHEIILKTGAVCWNWRETVVRFHYRNLGITSLAKSSIDCITFECSILPKDMLAPKYPMPCSSRSLVIRSTHCSGVPK